MKNTTCASRAHQDAMRVALGRKEKAYILTAYGLYEQAEEGAESEIISMYTSKEAAEAAITYGWYQRPEIKPVRVVYQKPIYQYPNNDQNLFLVHRAKCTMGNRIYVTDWYLNETTALEKMREFARVTLLDSPDAILKERTEICILTVHDLAML